MKEELKTLKDFEFEMDGHIGKFVSTDFLKAEAVKRYLYFRKKDDDAFAEGKIETARFYQGRWRECFEANNLTESDLEEKN